MNPELETLQHQVDEAINRIQRLEENTKSATGSWRFLVARAHPWRRQLSIKGRNMTVGQLISSMTTNGLTDEQAADDFNLPNEAIQEARRYFHEEHALIELEAAEERRRLMERGIRLEPQTLP